MASIHPQTLPAGTRLGVYEIHEAANIGIFDVTYKAWNHHLKEWVAIQEYFPGDLARRSVDGLGVEAKTTDTQEDFDDGFKAFLAQAEILSQVEHPNIIGTENVLRFNGTVYRVSSYHEGEALAKAAQSPATIADADLTAILASMLGALQKVHDRHLMHCGIHPGTIVLGKNGAALLTGFASAQVDLATKLDKLPEVLTAGFTAPELYSKNNSSRPASDFYALGATLYYFIFHKQPPAYQERLMALSRGEADPLSFPAASVSRYNPVFLQAIDWMLRPGLYDRPQSVGEILALLNSASTAEQKAQAVGNDAAKAKTTYFSMGNKPIWLAAAGLAGLVVLGFWLGNNTPDTEEGRVNTLANPPLSQGDQNGQLAQAQVDNPVSQPAVAQPGQTPAPDIQVKTATQEGGAADEKLVVPVNPAGSPSQAINVADKTDLPISHPVARPARKSNASVRKEKAKSQKTAKPILAAHRPNKPKLPESPSHADSIEGYLAAARQAMKEVRFTTPPGNNAYQYYQQVLARDPGNREALAGKRRIVKRYAWFIRKSKADGEIGRAERVLKKAESVSPDDPRLRQIREELQSQ